MKKAKQVKTLLLGIVFLVSCSSMHSETEINLNNGEKWEVNQEMKPPIENAQSLLNDYQSRQDSNYQALAKNLQGYNTDLISSCTMKGESHEELHKWLLPHMKLIEDLSNASNADEAEKLIGQIEESFKSYHKYFQ